ncbi:polyphenol oxidase [Panicum miliaceum]|uniref:Polyphenol oxidase n=1 Tax=Panicum miliaceum TaxID=4540 RepID=A0A3L6PZT2_PANMI|nr:polyphenol oxidase [Panicum miliaceum]
MKELPDGDPRGFPRRGSYSWGGSPTAPDPGAGTIEDVPHGPLHGWVGDPRQPNGEDMGNFYSTARDPVFFALHGHGNIDRLWHVWRGLSPGNTGFAATYLPISLTVSELN